MSSMDDLPPIPPENQFFFRKRMEEFLFPPKGQVIYSAKMAKRIVQVILSKVKKDPASVRRIAGSLKATPELDALVAKELDTYKVKRS